MSIRVVTDSACDLPQALRRRARHRDRAAHDPLRRRGVRRPRRADDRGVLAQGRALASAARDRGTVARRVRGAFRERSARGADGIVCINLSSRLSATMQSAQVAAAAVDGDLPVQVVDSLSVSMGLGNQCLTAARRAADGDRSSRSSTRSSTAATAPGSSAPSTRSSTSSAAVGSAAPRRCSAGCSRSSRSSRSATASSRRPARCAPGPRPSSSSPTKAAGGPDREPRRVPRQAPDSTSSSTRLEPIVPPRRDHHGRDRSGDRHPRRGPGSSA